MQNRNPFIGKWGVEDCYIIINNEKVRCTGIDPFDLEFTSDFVKFRLNKIPFRMRVSYKNDWKRVIVENTDGPLKLSVHWNDKNHFFNESIEGRKIIRIYYKRM